MLSLSPPRLASLGPAPALPATSGLIDDQAWLDCLRALATGAARRWDGWRVAARVHLHRARPRRGHAAVAGLALAVVSLASLGLLPAVAPVEAPGVVSAVPVVELARHPDRTGPGPSGLKHTGDLPVAVAPEPPAGPRLSRVSPPAGPPAGPPPPAAAAPEAPADPPGQPRLHRLSRPQVRSVAPSPSLALAATPGAVAVVPTDAGALPLGKGMWLYLPEEVEGGDVEALVARARQVGLTHVYVRTGSSKGGFYAQGYLDELLPKAHAAGLRVYGWDFPYLDDVEADVSRALAAIAHTTPGGERLDGFAADIETASEGTNLSAERAGAYGQLLRARVGPAYSLVVVVPRPSAKMQTRYPYQAVIPPFDAVAPMTYWLNRQPDSDVVNDVTFLASFGKPVLPIGQAYDGSPEGGRPGPPPPEEIRRFLGAAQQVGAAGVSFWSWQHATQAIWDTIQAAPEFRWEAGSPGELRPEQVRALQFQLSRLGFPVAASGTWDEATAAALADYQQRALLPRTAVLDAATLAVLMEPFNPPLADLPGQGHDRGRLDLGLLRLGG
ncbi:MAG: peptidoglycan-binding protein [Actinomycetota bacterium]|nr:peptidoglycan-binding protein [Actinomycetota bacterium]